MQSLHQIKEGAVRLINQEGISLTQMAQDLSLNKSMLRRWGKEANLEGLKTFGGHGFLRDKELAR